MDDDALKKQISRGGRTPARQRQGGADDGAGTPGGRCQDEAATGRNNAGAAFPFLSMAYLPFEGWHCRQGGPECIAGFALPERRAPHELGREPP